MNSCVFTKVGVDFLTDAEIPSIKNPSDVLVRVEVVGVNRADFNIGQLPSLLRSAAGIVGPGFDVCGVVAEAGPESPFSVGDRVCGVSEPPHSTPSYASYAVFPSDHLCAVPQDDEGEELVPSLVAGSFGMVSEVAIQMYKTFLEFGDDGTGADGLLEGRSVCVIGASGGVGSFCVVLAKYLFRAEKVYAVCSERNFDFVRRIGGDQCIDYSQENFAEVISEDDENDADLVAILDCVGLVSNIADGLAILPVADGNYVNIGVPPYLGSIIMNSFRNGWRYLKAAFGRHAAFHNPLHHPNGRQYEFLIRWYGDLIRENENLLIPIEELEFSSDGVVEALDRMESSRTVGKIAFVMPAPEEEESEGEDL